MTDRTAGPRYAELHAHSAFSFLDGASHPEELAAEGARLGLSALAITDHDGLYGVVRFAEAARKVGLPTVFGAELHLPAPTATGAPVLDPPTGVPAMTAGRRPLTDARQTLPGEKERARGSAGDSCRPPAAGRLPPDHRCGHQ